MKQFKENLTKKHNTTHTRIQLAETQSEKKDRYSKIDHHAADGDELVDVCKAGRGQLVPAGRGPPQAGGQLGRVWLCCPAWENLTGGMEVLGWRGSQGDTTARARTSRWVPSALAWDVPPVTSVLPLNPLSLLTLAELGRPEAAWGRPDL